MATPKDGDFTVGEGTNSLLQIESDKSLVSEAIPPAGISVLALRKACFAEVERSLTGSR